jgi:hypothetical protein
MDGTMNSLKKRIYWSISVCADRASARIEKIQAWAYHRYWMLTYE